MIQSLWNPFRDWNIYLSVYTISPFKGFKASETLLGIETRLQLEKGSVATDFDSKPLKPF